MRRKKLGNYGVILIILAGFFQLITLSLDQYVIQIEENNRTIIEKISNHSNEKNYSLENNRLIGSIMRHSFFENLIISAMDFDNKYKEYTDNTKRYFYRNIFKSQHELLGGIISDVNIRDNLCNKTFRDIIPAERAKLVPEKILKLETCKQFEYVKKKALDGVSYLDNYVPKDFSGTQINVDYIEYFLDALLLYFGETQNKKKNILYELNNELHLINQKKQLFLLFSLVSQLLSFLFLLILFRRILK